MWRIDKNSGEKLESYETIKFAAKWVFDQRLTSITVFNGGNNIKTKICAVCRGRRKTTYGFRWEYDNEDKKKYLNEIWKEIPPKLVHGTTGYQISDMGRVRNHKGRITEGYHKPNNYKWVSIYPKQYLLHRLVAKIFLPNFDRKPIVNHKNGNKSDAKLYNLEWNTYSENSQHAIKTKLLDCEKAVVQYDQQMNMLGIFRSQTNASNVLNISVSCISKCCLNKQKTAGGFIFMLNDE